MTQPCEQAEKIGSLVQGQEMLEKILVGIREDLKEIARRPSWAVSIILTLLTTTCAGLIIYIVTTR